MTNETPDNDSPTGYWIEPISTTMARALSIVARGWTQYTLSDFVGSHYRYCAIGAIGKAVDHAIDDAVGDGPTLNLFEDREEECKIYLLRALGKEGTGRNMSWIIDWNDADGRRA